MYDVTYFAEGTCLPFGPVGGNGLQLTFSWARHGSSSTTVDAAHQNAAPI